MDPQVHSGVVLTRKGQGNYTLRIAFQCLFQLGVVISCWLVNLGIQNETKEKGNRLDMPKHTNGSASVL